MDHKFTKMDQKINNNLPKNYQNRQNMTDVRSDVRADVLNPMMLINCKVFNTAELIHI